MNAKYQAKPRTWLALAVWLIPLSVAADDGNLTQQLHGQQQQSRFQLMLEQVAASARRRAAAQSAPTTRAGPSAPIDLGDWSEPARLEPVTVTEPVSLEVEAHAARRLWARQAYERDQQRNLHHRQQRRALIAGPRTGRPVVIDSFSRKRRELVRFNAQNQRLSLQRKLRR